MSGDLRSGILLLGIGSTRAFVGGPKDKSCVERFSHTLKEQLLWV
jgi:hypothetical protein